MKKRKSRLTAFDLSNEVGNTVIGQDRKMREKQVWVSEQVKHVVPCRHPERSRMG